MNDEEVKTLLEYYVKKISDTEAVIEMPVGRCIQLLHVSNGLDVLLPKAYCVAAHLPITVLPNVPIESIRVRIVIEEIVPDYKKIISG